MTSTRVGLVAALVVPLMLASASSGRAAPEDATAAALTNAADQAESLAEPQDPDVTCAVEAGGRDLVQHATYGFIGPQPTLLSTGLPTNSFRSVYDDDELYGQDTAFGAGLCESLDASRVYAARITVRMQWFERTSATAGVWRDLPCAGSSAWGESVEGAVTPTPVALVCTYGFAQNYEYLGFYHRAEVVVQTSVGTTRRAYSPVWYMER